MIYLSFGFAWFGLWHTRRSSFSQRCCCFCWTVFVCDVGVPLFYRLAIHSLCSHLIQNICEIVVWNVRLRTPKMKCFECHRTRSGLYLHFKGEIGQCISVCESVLAQTINRNEMKQNERNGMRFFRRLYSLLRWTQTQT